MHDGSIVMSGVPTPAQPPVISTEARSAQWRDPRIPRLAHTLRQKLFTVAGSSSTAVSATILSTTTGCASSL
jgi:hypothetical protein